MTQNRPSGRQIAAARTLLGLSRLDLAKKAGLSTSALERIEDSDVPIPDQAETALALQAALETAGVIFIAEDGAGAGVRLKKPRDADEGLKPEELNASNDD